MFVRMSGVCGYLHVCTYEWCVCGYLHVCMYEWCVCGYLHVCMYEWCMWIFACLDARMSSVCVCVCVCVDICMFARMSGVCGYLHVFHHCLPYIVCLCAGEYRTYQ